ncbi:C4-dicarboxylic acid transporter DauA [Hydrogenovibrio sp. SC-1]|uniref:C4-dicarboxylic acid transporter DauA n=1 Tax=Hydrogenovibrio sp. SC-1 TaxID=2065820 RepID=UPI000C79F8A4|nr:C4-dicarboxylic acid transporter DauA [Hydrogenovibrio sp. SC-1]PLA74391.1 C4-dicarboxylic acid transporter DauA [Hydrogenovibrio sp. SC-1]
MFSALKNSFEDRISSASIQGDINAGLTVGVIALPLSMALAIAIGVPPQHGLYTAMITGILVALIGGSRVNISGPTAAFVVVLLPIVQQFGFGGLLISGFLAGVILVLLGLSKLGRLIEIVPYPVIIGFTAGIGVVIATFQVVDFLGLEVATLEGHFFDKVWQILLALPSLDWQEAIIGFITLLVLILWPKSHSKIPGHLIAILVGTLIAMGLNVSIIGFDVETIGSRFQFDVNGLIGQGIPPLLPQFEWPWNLPNANGTPIGFSFELFRTLLPAAMTIAILGALESLLCATAADGMSGKKHQPNDELIGQGIGNMVVPFFGGIPATAAIARTAANVKAGGTTPLASVIHGLFILLAIIVFAPILSYIPMSSMAALLIMVAWNMSESHHFARIIKSAPRGDVIVLLTCFILTVLFDMTIAVAIGMAMAASLFIKRSIDVTTNDRVPQHEHPKGLPDEIAVYDINGPLFFGTAQKTMNQLNTVSPEVRIVVLDMREVSMIDMSAIIAMETIIQNFEKHKISMVINQLQPRLLLKLRKAGLRKREGKIEFTNAYDDAIAHAKALLADLK